MRAIIPLFAVLSLLLSACVTTQEGATETAVAIQAAVTAEAATAQAQEASAAATIQAAVTPTEETEDEADAGDEGDAESGDAVTIVASNGCEITFFGPFEARRGDDFIVEWRVVCGGDPGVGTFFATLGNPPSSANATHASGALGAGGNITLTLEVNWDTGETTLFCSYEGEVYEVTQITILESG